MRVPPEAFSCLPDSSTFTGVSKVVICLGVKVFTVIMSRIDAGPKLKRVKIKRAKKVGGVYTINDGIAAASG